MLTQLDLDADDILAFRVEGALTAADFERAFGALAEKLSTHERIRLYLDVVSLGAMTREDVWKDMERGLLRAGTLARIERVAMVSNLEWVRQVASLGAPALRGVQIRAFPITDLGRARSWMRE